MHSSDIKQDYDRDKLLRDIYSQFLAEGNYLSGRPFGNGHIHDTYLVETDGTDNYILQKLNNNVFRKIPEMQENIERVTDHIIRKLSSVKGSDPKRECLTFIKTSGGKTWILDSSMEYWRMSIYIRDHRSYELMDTVVKAAEAGRAIGRFQSMVSDLGGKPLHETIPYFQHVGNRLETFFSKISEDPVQRVRQSSGEIDFLAARAEKMKILLKMGNDGQIPVRITHNDTKFNNILFDLDDRSLCLIDLDTVMPGFVHYDFGDAMRTGANMAAEDEADLTKVVFDIGKYRAFAEGYISEASGFLTRNETEWLAFSPLLITYTQAVRFLTDYIDGDTYYKIHHPEHNLQRTRAQIHLIKSMEDQYQAMREIIAAIT